MPATAGAIRAGKAFVELFADDTRLVRGLRAAQSKLRNFGRMITTVGAGLFGIGAATASAFIPAIKAASSLEEVTSKFGVVFGENSAAMLQWGDEFAGQMGRSKRQIREFLSGSQDLLVPMGIESGAAEEMSKTLTGLAIDLASFNDGISDDDAMRDLQAALTGSGEVMKKYGVLLDQAAVNQELFNQGLDPTNATNAQKAQARLNIILGATTAAQGDAIRSSGTFANQMKRLKGLAEDLGASIGSAILPVVTSAATLIGDLAEKAGEWISVNQSLIATVFTVGTAVAAAGVALIGFGVAATVASFAIGGIASVIGAVGGAMAFLLTPAGAITAALALITVGIGILIAQSGLLKPVLRSLGKAFGIIGEQAGVVFGGIKSALATGDFAGAMRVATAGMNQAWTAAIGRMKVAFAEFKLNVISGFSDIVQNVLSKIGRILDGYKAVMQGMLSVLGPIGGAAASASVGASIDSINAVRANVQATAGAVGAGATGAAAADLQAAQIAASADLSESQRELIAALDAVAESSSLTDSQSELADKAARGAAEGTHVSRSLGSVGSFSGNDRQFHVDDNPTLKTAKETKDATEKIADGVDQMNILLERNLQFA